MLQKQTVESNTLELLINIQSLPEMQDFRLVGGTALSLSFGHRISTDLDLFSFKTEIPQEIQSILFSRGFKVENISLSERIKILRVNNIKVDFVNYGYQWLKGERLEDNIRLASLEDIGAMKLSAITNRGTRKDFVDLYFLLEVFDFKQLVDFYHKKYPEAEDFLMYKSLLYFEDAENEPMPKMIKTITWNEIKSRIIEIVKQEIQK